MQTGECVKRPIVLSIVIPVVPFVVRSLPQLLQRARRAMSFQAKITSEAAWEDEIGTAAAPGCPGYLQGTRVRFWAPQRDRSPHGRMLPRCGPLRGGE